MGWRAREAYREVVFENIGYEYLDRGHTQMDREQLDEMSGADRGSHPSVLPERQIRVAGDDYPAEVVCEIPLYGLWTAPMCSMSWIA